MGETRARAGIAWGQLLLVTALAGVALAYLVEARGVSLSPQNLLLLQPTAWLVLALWAVIAAGSLRPPPRDPAAEPESRMDLLRVVAMVAAFGAFIAGLEQAGYDIAICAFMLVGLMIGGERNPLMLAIVPPVFTLVVIYGFRALVPYPFSDQHPLT